MHLALSDTEYSQPIRSLIALLLFCLFEYVRVHSALTRHPRTLAYCSLQSFSLRLLGQLTNLEFL
jgi:hypothetical protein